MWIYYNRLPIRWNVNGKQNFIKAYKENSESPSMVAEL